MILFPFSISLIFLSLAFVTSKLQYHSTYLTIAIYSVLGPIQTGAIAFSVYTFLKNRIDQTIMILFFTSLFLIFLLNLIAYVIQSCYLLEDRKFRKWANRRAKTDDYKINLIWFHIICFLAFVSNYKLKMLFFSRLFNFQCFKFQLSSLDKFKAFNILSFAGYFPQILSLYCCFMGLLYFRLTQEEVFAFIDCLIIVIMNMIFSIAIIYKENDFFREEVDGLPMNHVVNVIQEMNSATAIMQQKERSNKQRVGNRALEDISEYEEFAYNSTKRQRNMKFTGNARISQKEDSCFFEDNSEVNTGSRIHSQASQNQEHQAVVANCVEEEVIVNQAFKNILEVDQNYDEESSEQISTKEKENIVSLMISRQQPLNFPNEEISLAQKMKEQFKEQEKADQLTRQMRSKVNGRLNISNTVQTNKKYDHIMEKSDDDRIQLIDQTVPSDQESSRKPYNFKLLINESALIESQQSVRRQLETPHNPPKLQNNLQQIAKMTVKRVVSAHHSPNRRIKIEGDIFKKAELHNVGLMHINEDHDQKPIKNKSAEKLKKYANNPLSSGAVMHPLYGKMHQTQQNKQQHSLGRQEDIEENRQHIFKKRGKVEIRANKLMETDGYSNLPNTNNNIYEEKQENSKQFKRSKPNNFSLAQFSIKNNTIDNIIYEKELTHGNAMRKPSERIQLKFNQMSQSPSQVLSRQQRHRFADKRERPFTSNNLNRRIKSLEKKSSSVVGKRKSSLEKIYLQKLIIF